jgi:hypothetical protein
MQGDHHVRAVAGPQVGAQDDDHEQAQGEAKGGIDQGLQPRGLGLELGNLRVGGKGSG